MKKLFFATIALFVMTTSQAQSSFITSSFSTIDVSPICSSISSLDLPRTPSVPQIEIPSVPSTINVQGYTRSNGTVVDSYMRTSPNITNRDNFSTIGNSNPYTGTVGSRARDYSNDAYNYGCGNTIYSGPRGGQYYINSNGNKTYVPKRY